MYGLKVLRNIARLPEDFMFQLTKGEITEDFLKSQIATLNEKGDKRGTNIKKMQLFGNSERLRLTEKTIIQHIIILI